jgi:hypothetical protein
MTGKGRRKMRRGSKNEGERSGPETIHQLPGEAINPLDQFLNHQEIPGYHDEGLVFGPTFG